MILVCMDRAQSEELGTLYFCGCQMYISFFFHFEVEKMAKLAIFSLSTCIVQVNIELLHLFICKLGKKNIWEVMYTGKGYA